MTTTLRYGAAEYCGLLTAYEPRVRRAMSGVATASQQFLSHCRTGVAKRPGDHGPLLFGSSLLRFGSRVVGIGLAGATVSLLWRDSYIRIDLLQGPSKPGSSHGHRRRRFSTAPSRRGPPERQLRSHYSEQRR